MYRVLCPVSQQLPLFCNIFAFILLRFFRLFSLILKINKHKKLNFIYWIIRLCVLARSPLYFNSNFIYFHCIIKSDDDSDADEITDYLSTNVGENKNDPTSSSQPIYSSTLNTERDLNHSSSSCSSSSTNSAHNNHFGLKKTYATLASTTKMVTFYGRGHRIKCWFYAQIDELTCRSLFFFHFHQNVASAFTDASGVNAATGE